MTLGEGGGGVRLCSEGVGGARMIVQNRGYQDTEGRESHNTKLERVAVTAQHFHKCGLDDMSWQG